MLLVFRRRICRFIYEFVCVYVVSDFSVFLFLLFLVWNMNCDLDAFGESRCEIID